MSEASKALPSIPTTTLEYRVTEFTGFQALELQQTGISPPKENEVLVKINAVSLQYRDLIIAKEQYPLGAVKNVVPGSDAAGEILAVGSDVKGFKPGDRVSANFAVDHVFGDVDIDKRNSGLGGKIDGVLTKYRNFPAYSLVHIPEHLSYEEASTLPCAGVTAYNALNGPVPLKGGDVILVQGTGGVSIFALQFAKASGATVIATTSSDQKAEYLKKLGADHIINYKQVENWDEEVLKLTNGRGVDHVIEVGGSGTIQKSFNSTRFGGWIHSVGFLASSDPAPDLHIQCLVKAIFLRGILVGSRAQYEDMNRLITAAKIKPVVDKVFTFEKVIEAYEYLESQKHVGKVVVKVSND